MDAALIMRVLLVVMFLLLHTVVLLSSCATAGVEECRYSFLVCMKQHYPLYF